MKPDRLLLTMILALVLFAIPLEAARRPHADPELYWSHLLADRMHGEAEARTDDGARADIVTADEAIEVDWAPKWAEGVGQALYYGTCFHKKPVVILLVTDREAEAPYIARCRKAAKAGGVGVRLYSVASRTYL